MSRSRAISLPVCTIAVLQLLIGCAAQNTNRPATLPARQQAETDSATRPTSPPTELRWYANVRTYCVPPAGWSAAPITPQAHSEQQLWLSPSGATAYGVIAVHHLLLPLASDEMVLNEFLKQMKASEGAGDLLEKRHYATLAHGIGGLRFIARGGRYVVHGNLVSSGASAWIVYAGTETRQAVQPDELKDAETAREATVIEPELKR